MNQETSPPAFEDAIAELEKIVERMESGELTLEASLAAFETGIKLTRACQSALERAELRVNQLLADGTTVDLKDRVVPPAGGEAPE